MFKKSKKTGVVMNFGTNEYQEYVRKRKTVKELHNAQNQLRANQREFQQMRNELAEVKEMLAQVLRKE